MACHSRGMMVDGRDHHTSLTSMMISSLDHHTIPCDQGNRRRHDGFNGQQSLQECETPCFLEQYDGHGRRPSYCSVQVETRTCETRTCWSTSETRSWSQVSAHLARRGGWGTLSEGAARREDLLCALRAGPVKTRLAIPGWPPHQNLCQQASSATRHASRS